MPGHAQLQRGPHWWPDLRRLADLERLLPSGRISRTHDHQHARLFLLSHLLGPLIGLSLCGILLLEGFPADPRLLGFALLVSLFWIYPAALRMGAHYRLLSLLSLEHLVVVILWAGHGYGGLLSPFLVWLPVVPLLAFLYLSPSYRLWLGILAMLALNIAIFAWIETVVPAPPRSDPAALGSLGLLSMLSASAYVAMMATYFSHVLMSRGDLEQEVAQHRSTAAALNEAAAEVRRAGEAKAEFVARMSHELRAPLNAVIGYGQLLLEDAVANNEHEVIGDLESITGSGQYLLSLIDDVLDYSRIDAGAMELQRTDVEVAPLLEKVAERVRPLAEQRNNRLSLVVAPEAGVLATDAALLEKALFGVARHCAQSTSEGWIELRAWPEIGDTLAIEISDDGPPIPTARLASLFDPLGVESDAGATKYGGHGIALALAKRICGLLGGSIDITSERSRGSRFRIVLPRSA